MTSKTHIKFVFDNLDDDDKFHNLIKTIDKMESFPVIIEYTNNDNIVQTWVCDSSKELQTFAFGMRMAIDLIKKELI